MDGLSSLISSSAGLSLQPSLSLISSSAGLSPYLQFLQKMEHAKRKRGRKSNETHSGYHPQSDGLPNEVGTNPRESIELSSGINICNTLEELILFVYPRLSIEGALSEEFLTERTILAARNDDVSVINETVLNMFPGETHEYLAADKVIEDDINNQANRSQYPSEFLNSLDPPGIPPFRLKLKIGCPVMLLRNLAPKDGLCNGTRLMVIKCGNKVIEAKILTGNKVGNYIFIPRISLTPSNIVLPFQMSRRQFPIRLSYAMTINKSQGQSVKYVGIDLRMPVFSHGQLYVALSRCTSAQRISVILPPDSSNYTTNVVYPEVLL